MIPTLTAAMCTLFSKTIMYDSSSMYFVYLANIFFALRLPHRRCSHLRRSPSCKLSPSMYILLDILGQTTALEGATFRRIPTCDEGTVSVDDDFLKVSGTGCRATTRVPTVWPAHAQRPIAF